MKYRNTNTGEAFTLEEIKTAYEQFKHEMDFDSFEDFVDEFEEVEDEQEV